MAPSAPVRVPADVQRILERLWSSGHAAYVVGGGVRDDLLGREAKDWDVATAARPQRIIELFPDGRYENRFGTVNVADVEVTTFRRDHRYADHRRPDSVTFTDDVTRDLLRRDFTVNAIAWGRVGDDPRRNRDEPPPEPALVDPAGGLADLEARLLRAVGDPRRRFDEDSLRLLRAARLAAQLGFQIEPETRAAMAESAPLLAWVSSERVGAELLRMLATDPPSAGLRVLDETGLLAGVFPELAAQRGVEQSKIEGHDLWQHCLATLDAAAVIDPSNMRLRLAALLHDIGKPTTQADGRFIGHDLEGALLAERLLARLAVPRREAEPVVRLIRQHMFHYQPQWTNAALRRFLRRVGRDLVHELIRLRQADNVGSGWPADAGHLDELRRRVDAELAAGAPLSLAELAIDGQDLIDELGLVPGPGIGRLLERLLDSVITDPSRNTRAVLLADARGWATELAHDPSAGQAAQSSSTHEAVP